MRVLFIGDIVGKPGREMVRRSLPALVAREGVDLTVANGENAAGGNGITAAVAADLFDCGVDVLTLGNHTWDKKEFVDEIDKLPSVVRPANFPPGTPGLGWLVVRARGGSAVAVCNLMGRALFGVDLDCPFRWLDDHLAEMRAAAPLVLVDFHAEATSEKMAFARYADGRVAAVVGTHTHVQTADERLLPGGTAYITDVGMTGPRESVIGIESELVLRKFLTQMPVRFEVARGPCQLNGALLELDEATGLARGIRRIQLNDE